MRTSFLTCAAVTGSALALCSTASADRPGSGPVRAPRVVDILHVSFPLVGDTWGQLHSVSGGGAIPGSYVFQPGPVSPVDDGFHFQVTGDRLFAVEVGAALAKTRPRLRGTRLTVRPGLVLDVRHHGVDGPVRWWAGRIRETGDPAAIGYQRAPGSLSPGGDRWLVYHVFGGVHGDPGSQHDRIVAQGAPKVLAVAKAMRLAPGAATSAPPYAGV